MAIANIRFINIIEIMYYLLHFTMCFDLGGTKFMIFNGIGDIFGFLILN